MKKKIFFGGVGGIFLTIAGLMLYVMSTMEMKVLISCSANEGGIRIPGNLCHYYMVNYRINEKGIKELSDGAGLDYILNGESPKNYELAKIFLANGLDVNGINHYGSNGATPLQAAVLYNDVKRVKFLLEYGADLHITGAGGMTALEIARKFHKEESKLENRSEIIRILSDAGNTD